MTRATASLALATLAITFATSCTDVWNEHFDTANKLRASDKTLWEEICSHPELDGFRKILEQTGCDRELDGDQMFTVFAPQGAISTEGLTVDGMRDEIAYNHIARFATSANNELKEPRNIMLMNDKMGEFASESGTYTFSRQPLVKQNILAKNGVLHIIGGQIPFFCNVWEYMDKDTLYSSIRDYLYSFNEIELNEEASVAGAVVDGQITYVDSVTVNTNEMFYRLGQLNDEDSTYWMILPTNKAWEKAYRKVSSYYTYSTKNAARDSLQRHYTQMAMVSDLVFSHTMQRTPEDSIVGTPQGGNLSPLLANIMLNELDKEMEKRGLNFVRYADDCIIMVGSEMSANRVMRNISRFIEEKLGLKVNMTKSKVDRPSGLKYLGFGFYFDSKAHQFKAKPHAKSVTKFKKRMKELTCRSWGVSNSYKVEKLNQLIRGWINYFKIGSMKTLCKEMDARIRFRLRMCIWKQWKTPQNRIKA